MMYLGNQAVGIAKKLSISTDYLKTLTFTNALGANGRQTVIPDASWEKYNALIFVPHISVDPQPGIDTNAYFSNWFWYEISDGTNNSNTYDGDGAQGLRYEKYSMLLIHDNALHEWRFGCFCGNRHAIISSDADLTDIRITIGPYYGNTYAYMNGTIDIYGLYIDN